MADTAIDFRNWQIPLSRRFRALKLWFVIRNYGVTGLQSYIRRHVKLAHYFAFLMSRDKNFQICNEVTLGLVCFQLKNSNRLTKILEERLNQTRKIFVISAQLKEKHVIRFCVVSENCRQEHVVYAWNLIRRMAEEILCEEKACCRDASSS
ncbi:Tdc2 [Cordylochernes scorpioides]|uniref:Tdc2 n=1 Tax=Cordylochernes scorpioides TaxID=51811 RepID=A0ABY6L2L9_9ARAC|nr:Tdc2 [Cordylochernes scorpioides]